MKKDTKNPAAVALGRLGGNARKVKMNRKQLSAAARVAANARWAKVRETETR